MQNASIFRLELQRTLAVQLTLKMYLRRVVHMVYMFNRPALFHVDTE